MTAHLLTLTAHDPWPSDRTWTENASIVAEGMPIGRLVLMRFAGSPGEFDDAEAIVRDRLTVQHSYRDEEGITLVGEPAGELAMLLRRLASGPAILLSPIRWYEGCIHVRLLAFDEMGREEVQRLVPDATLVSKAPLRGGEVEREMLSSNLLLPSLTRRQGEAVLAALDAGYYDAPRRVTTAEVADIMGVARSTFEEHLKAAESQIVRAIAPVVDLRLTEMERGRKAAGKDALHLFARFSEDLGLYVNLALRDGRVTGVSLAPSPAEGSEGAEHPYLSRIIDHLSTGRDDLLDIPLDLEVSPFEREVLDTLRTIPPGEVVTYGELASRLGRPKASRAVGNACARNPAIVVVPCHRVVPASGGLGNYSGQGGPATKAWLLEREGALGKVKRGRKTKQMERR